MITEVTKKLMRGEDLTPEEASKAMTQIMTGQAGEVRTAAFLTALAIKGETGTEIEACARSMRNASVPWPNYQTENLADTCGTGGDSLNTINVSTLSALLLASLGIQVAKHGNRAVSSSTGSADLLEESGVRLEMEEQEVVQCLNKNGITFLFAPRWHPAMKHAGPVRKTLGFRTVFNILGPITNPAPIAYQTLGVFSRSLLDPIAGALSGLGRKGAYVIHSEDGLDEVSIAAPTHFVKVKDGAVVDRGVLEPETFGFQKAPLETIQVKDRKEALEKAKRILEGKGTEEENATITMNAALVFSMVKGVDDLKQAAKVCLEELRSGRVQGVLENWASFVHEKN